MYVTCFLHASLENDDPVLRHVGTTNHIFSMSKHTSLYHCACTRVLLHVRFVMDPYDQLNMHWTHIMSLM